jgi:acyl-CoA thioesterase YciA
MVMDLLVTHPVKKMDIGFHGNLYGGRLLEWLDAAVAAYAMEACCNRRMVTISIDKCEFKKPAKEGSLVKIYAETSQIGNSSATFDVEARAYNVYTGNHSVILSTQFTFVRIDEDGNPIPISKQVRDDFYNL